MKFGSFSTFKPIEWLLVALLLLAPFYFHYNIGGTGFRIPNNIVIWFVASIICFYSLYKFSNQRSFYLPQHYLLIMAFPVLVFFSGFSAGVEIATTWVFRLLFIWGGLLFLLSLFQHRLTQGRIDRILFFIVLSGLFHAFVGLAQIFWLKHLPTWLPMNANGIPTGMFQQINNQASFQVTAIIIALWLVSRPIVQHGKSGLYCLIVLSVACSSFIVSYSGSRVGVLALVLALPLLLLSRWHKIVLDKKRWLILLVIFVIAMISATAIERKHGNVGLASMIDKTTAINAGFSGSSRLGIYTIAYNVFKEQPIFGHGIGSFIRVWQLGKPDFYASHPNATLPDQRVAHPHNEIIFWLIEGGIVAGIGLLCLFFAVFFTLKKLPASRRYAYIAFLIPLVLHTQVELPFYISAEHWFVFLLLLFVIMNPYRRQHSVVLSDAARKLLKVIAIVSGLLSTVFLSHTMASTFEFKRFILKQSPPDNPFPIALHNPYFKRLAAETIITQLFYVSMQHGLTENVRDFAQWGEQELKHNPHILYYKLTVEALSYLKKNKHACEITRQGLTIYPDDTTLIEILGRCEERNL